MLFFLVNLLKVEVDWFDVELLRHHDPPHDSIDKEGEEDIAEEDEYTHQELNEQFLHSLHPSSVVGG